MNEPSAKKVKPRRGRDEGMIRQEKSGKYRVMLSKIVDGKRVRPSKLCKSKAEAIAWRDAEKGKPVASKDKLSDWLRDWLELIKPDVANKTHAHDRWRVERYLVPRLGNIRLKDLTGRHVRAMLAAMAEENYSDSERQKAGAVLRKALNAAVDAELLSASPMSRVKLPTPKRPDKRAMDGEQLRAFIQAAEEKSGLGAVMALWADAGLRPAEMLGLRWEDIELEGGKLHVRRALDGVTNKEKEPKTRKSRRTIALAASTVAGLMLVKKPKGPVLPDSKGKYFWPSNFLSEVFDPIRKAAGMSWVMPGTARHTMATLLLRAGVPLKVVSERLGHEDVTTTLRSYAHVLEGDQGRAAAAMDGILKG